MTRIKEYWAIVVESALFGAMAMNAFWHPSPVTLGGVVVMFGLLLAFVMWLVPK